MVRTRPIMTKARLDGLYLLLLGSLVLVLMGTVLASKSSVAMVDFKGVYYDTRCLLQHTDPYIPGEPLRLYLAEGGRLPQSDGPQQVLMLDIYPPTTSIFVALSRCCRGRVRVCCGCSSASAVSSSPPS
jgi:hypothetical protein